MSTFRSLALSFGIFGLCIAASNLYAGPLTPGRIIGTNNLVHVPASAANEPRIQAIGRLKLGCTVTHVGNGIAITAGHCFASNNFEGVHENIPCSDVRFSVRWGVTYGTSGYLTSQCMEVIATELNGERDYAIFRVSPVPPSKIELAEHAPQLDSDISIYSHPRMRPMEWSQWCKVEGFVEKSNNNQFFYSCDTEGGSSGAAVLNSEFKVVGIHNYYTNVLDRNGATLVNVTPLVRILTLEQAKHSFISELNNSVSEYERFDNVGRTFAQNFLRTHSPLFANIEFLKTL